MLFSKVFHCSVEALESEMNTWLASKPSITIVSTNQSKNVVDDTYWDIVLTIIYKN